MQVFGMPQLHPTPPHRNRQHDGIITIAPPIARWSKAQRGDPRGRNARQPQGSIATRQSRDDCNDTIMTIVIAPTIIVQDWHEEIKQCGDHTQQPTLFFGCWSQERAPGLDAIVTNMTSPLITQGDDDETSSCWTCTRGKTSNAETACNNQFYFLGAGLKRERRDVLQERKHDRNEQDHFPHRSHEATMKNGNQDAETMAIATISLFLKHCSPRRAPRDASKDVLTRHKSDNHSNVSKERRNDNVKDMTMTTMMIMTRAIVATVATNLYA